jgi:5-methylcytosine-specific restriction endonuclease McrA
MDHRTPAKPEHYETAIPGYCRYCGEGIFKPGGKLNQRANWHPACVAEYRVIYWPAETRRAVWRRDKGLCAGCAHKCAKHAWEMDHIVPLFEAQGDIEAFKLPNLQTLCLTCHKIKTGGEATIRAERRARSGQKLR